MTETENEKNSTDNTSDKSKSTTGRKTPKNHQTVTRVTSINQNSGQTANVINNNFGAAEKSRPSKLEKSSWIAGIIAAIIAFLMFAFRFIGENTMDDAKSTNVESHNQSGGQTAGVINNNTTTINNNFGPPPRTLTERMKKDILELTPEHEQIRIVVVANDPEAEQLAQQIFTLLEPQRDIKNNEIVYFSGITFYDNGESGLMKDLTYDDTGEYFTWNIGHR